MRSVWCTFAPTGSPVKVFRYNYHADAIAPLQRIIESEDKGLNAAVKAFRAQKQAVGNVELDVCSKPLVEIAHELNFSSPSYLSRYIKRVFDCSPSEYRKRLK